MATQRQGRVPFSGQIWAADNGCFTQPQAYSDDGYLSWLSVMPRGALFATAPDVVGDAAATLERSAQMLPRIRAAGFPAALVAQDGLTPDMVPWDDIDALFIGGTTDWKLGPDAPPLVDAAKALGIWVHMGRVNSWRRFEYARAIGCDSVDGTILRFDPRRDVAGWMARARREPQLGL